MKIKPLASSSAGNCYVIESNGQQLILDCGISVDRIRKEIGTFENVVGCFVSHEHGDHVGYVRQLEKTTGFPIYTTVGVFEKESAFYITPIEHGRMLKVGKFIVCPYHLQHDVECFGFLILTKTAKLFYATDTKSIPYTFPGLTHAIIEANFSWDLISESDMSNFVVQRTINSHLDLDSTLEFAERHPQLEELWLAHLSDRHSDAELFKKTAIDRLGIPVYICPK